MDVTAILSKRDKEIFSLKKDNEKLKNDIMILNDNIKEYEQRIQS
jgi:hypothetical protein